MSELIHILPTDATSGSYGQAIRPEFLNPEGSINDFKIIIGNQSAPNTLYSSWSAIQDQVDLLYKQKRREYFLIEAVRNFFRKQNFQELNESFENEEITEDQFEHELDSMEYKYVIALKNIESKSDVEIIANLIDEIGLDIRDLTLSEVSELFSINEAHLLSNLSSIKGRLGS